MSKIKKKLISFFVNQNDVVMAFLFGSYAEKRAHKLSDIDIGVYYSSSPSLKRHIELINNISSILNSDNFDVVEMNSTSPLILHDIFSFGEILICRDDELYISLRINKLRQYDDRIHILKIQCEHIFKESIINV